MNQPRKSGPVAVVTGLQHRTALGTVRSLSQMGVPVLGVSSQPDSPFAKTRLCQKAYCQDVNGEALIEKLIELGKSFDEKAVLFASNDPQVLLISEHRDLLAPYYHIGLPAKEVVRLLLDKTQFAIFAEKNGFPCPKTVVIRESTDIKNYVNTLQYPCVLKPFHRTEEWKKHNAGHRVLWIHRPEELEKTVLRALAWAEGLVLQEWIAGTDSEVYFCLVYFDNRSEPRATFVGKKIRQWLPEVGSTASAEKKFNPIVLEESLRLLKAVQYKGLGSIEYKYDPRDRGFKIIEPTVGRPDLQSYVAVANGINIPYVAYCDLIGQSMSQLDHPAHSGSVKWVNEWSEYRSARFYRKRGDLTLKEWYTSLRGPKKYSLFSLSDPLPFVFTLKQALTGTLSSDDT